MQNLLKGARIIETLRNYAIADKLESSFVDKSEDVDRCGNFYYNDQRFWRDVIRFKDEFWFKKVDLDCFVVSNWVARVPGLYWSDSATLIRQHNANDIAIVSEEYTEFNPPGKSKKVLGGVGTLLLAPAIDGTILMSVSASCNASTGIPVLCYPEVYEALKIKQGDCVVIKNATWQPMDIQWARQFHSTDIPRGYLVIDSVEKIFVFRSGYPVIYHPFSLMEYEWNGGQFYDFVYVSADSKLKNVDKRIKKFFDDYAKKEGRFGEYLINPNVVSPIFEARYLSPTELTTPSEKAKLNLLNERVKGLYFGDHSLEELISKIPDYYDSASSIKTLASNIGINKSKFEDSSAVNMSSQLIDLCIKYNKEVELIDRLSVEYNEIFN
jgi:hypothetical protein